MECRKGQEQNHSTIQRAGSEPLAPPKFALGLRAVAPLARAVGLSLSLLYGQVARQTLTCLWKCNASTYFRIKFLESMSSKIDFQRLCWQETTGCAAGLRPAKCRACVGSPSLRYKRILCHTVASFCFQTLVDTATESKHRQTQRTHQQSIHTNHFVSKLFKTTRVLPEFLKNTSSNH